ncbi:MAG: DUF1648 domain-containing protein [Bacteroidia bacterium]|nr:DUF1648 domain-containing protein [Bacteroidia bacterium]
METRPVIPLTPTLSDIMLESLAVGSLVVLWVTCIMAYGDLPDIIPVHFSLDGEADRFGSKNSVWFLPVIATVLYFILTFLNRIPYRFNYLKKITDLNAHHQYTLATRLIRWEKFLVIVVLFLTFESMRMAVSDYNLEFGTWLLPLVMVLILGPVIVYLLLSLTGD